MVKIHSVIRAIVYAKTKEEALEKAKGVFGDLCGEGRTFDYFTTFDEEGSEVSGRGRWGNLPAVSLASSKEGKKLIRDGIKFTRDEFIESIKKVRKGVELFSDEELWEGKVIKGHKEKEKVIEAIDSDVIEKFDFEQFRYYCNCIGEYSGSHIYLYDNDGSGIRTEKHLKDVLTKWKCIYEDGGKKNPFKDLDIFVIPSDVHF